MRGNDRDKYWCEPCDVVVKSRDAALCPHCAQPMRFMGDIWRPGPKGNRMRNYPEGWGNPPRPAFWWNYRHPGQKLRRGGRIHSYWMPPS